MLLCDAVGFPGRVFARVEFGAPGVHWPALSFARHSALQDWLLRFHPQRDIVILVGADDPRHVRPCEDRGRLLSAIQIDHPLVTPTRDLVSPQELARERSLHGERRDLSLPLARAWRFVDRPLARDAYPDMVQRFVAPHRRGAMIEVAASEAARLMREAVASDFARRPDIAARTDELLRCEPERDREFARAIRRIEGHVRKSGRLLSFRAGLRSMPNSAERLLKALRHRFVAQRGRCALCDRPIPSEPANPILQLSVDRIDNRNDAYSEDNIQITHLGCNRGRNNASLAHWSEYVALMRDRA
ncbi:MAG: hypothetical protein BGP06_02665 [Rhizobiales bacterium 65-9]|nr:MAG: hypothetical protein BGP06_02665 [Rhizobiales bacterium 65-9]